MNKIKQFILDNGLDFSGSGSELNSNCTIISGYALFIGITTTKELLLEMDELDAPAIDELYRVFEFANKNNYGWWWNRPKAANRYKF